MCCKSGINIILRSYLIYNNKHVRCQKKKKKHKIGNCFGVLNGNLLTYSTFSFLLQNYDPIMIYTYKYQITWDTCDEEYLISKYKTACAILGQ